MTYTAEDKIGYTVVDYTFAVTVKGSLVAVYKKVLLLLLLLLFSFFNIIAYHTKSKLYSLCNNI